MPVQRLKDYLDEKGIQYSAIHHAPAYTAQEIAASAHVPGKELAQVGEHGGNTITTVEGVLRATVIRLYPEVHR